MLWRSIKTSYIHTPIVTLSHRIVLPFFIGVLTYNIYYDQYIQINYL